MKHILITIILKRLNLAFLLIFLTATASDALHPTAVGSYRSAIANASKNHDRYSVLKLGELILTSSWRFDKSNRLEMQVQKELQQGMMSIPGHARLLGEEIEHGQEAVDGIPGISGPRGDYNGLRSGNFQILALLPSPETIQILGAFLADDKDLMGAGRGASVMANSSLAMVSLDKIGLRASPQKHPFTDLPGDVIVWRAWWEEIKTGTKAFSFLGQKVEYRFKPDGTWDTIPIANPRDDAPEPVVAQSPVIPPTSTASQTLSPRGNSWAWIVGATMIMLAVVVWLGLRDAPGSR